MKISAYYFEENDVTLCFIPIKEIPHYTHKVLILKNNTVESGAWLHESKTICKQTAEYYYNKFGRML